MGGSAGSTILPIAGAVIGGAVGGPVGASIGATIGGGIAASNQPRPKIPKPRVPSLLESDPTVSAADRARRQRQRAAAATQGRNATILTNPSQAPGTLLGNTGAETGKTLLGS